jgi:hypothetical protein
MKAVLRRLRQLEAGLIPKVDHRMEKAAAILAERRRARLAASGQPPDEELDWASLPRRAAVLAAHLLSLRSLHRVALEIAVAEQPLEHCARPDFASQRRTGCVPRDCIAVGASIATVAVAAPQPFFAAQFQRCKARLRAKYMLLCAR